MNGYAFPLPSGYLGAGEVPIHAATCERCGHNWHFPGAAAPYRGAGLSSSQAIAGALLDGWTRDADGWWTCGRVECQET